MFSFTSKGSFERTIQALQRMRNGDIFRALDAYGRAGVAALSAATPVDTGETANSWSYEISSGRGSYSIAWTNSHSAAGTPLVIMLQYGHGTGTGGYVQGRDFINPAIRPQFDEIADAVWREVTTA